MTIHWIELVGYCAALLTISCFYMKTIIPLRGFAITANIVTITFALASTPIIYPVLVTHLILFPLNCLRLYQMIQLIRDVKIASTDRYSFELLIPYMQKEIFQEGEVIFKKGDLSDKVYYIQEGRVKLPEVKKNLTAGDLFGEIGVLSHEQNRTSSAVCETKVIAQTLSQEQFKVLFYQNPAFGFYMMQTVIGRLLENVETLRERDKLIV